MSSARWISVVAPLLIGVTLPARAQSGSAPLSAVADAYLRAALDTLQAVTLDRTAIPWQSVRDSAFLLAAGARTARDTYGAIQWALRRVNKHSFLQAAPPGAVSTLVDGRYGYIRVPQRGGPGVSLADSLHIAVGTLQDAGACGWIVDLRGNGGGNMWPMLAGIGPLLGDTLVGQFGSGAGTERWYYRQGISGIVRPTGALDTVTRITTPAVELRRRDAPVAVLIDGGTGSSGEAMTIAFRGRPNSRSFGSSTAGFATVNRGARLSDGANMVVTIGYNADRQGTFYPERLEPDTAIAGAPPGWPFPTDNVSMTAIQWLAGQPGCRP
ncbi:MAG: hypothetical protein HOP28_13805 [Gemmatimonadales bacterium]|nr:hypothetical protein [Gemmatimonadales bacterium]